MSVDFEALINSAMRDGTSAQDLAAQFTAAMNNITNKSKEAEARNKYLTNIRAKAMENFSNSSGCYEDVAMLFTALVGFSEEGKDWDQAAIQEFYSAAVDFFPEMVKSYNTARTMATRAKNGLENLKERAAARSERFKEKINATTPDRDKDWESVKAFLDEIFS